MTVGGGGGGGGEGAGSFFKGVKLQAYIACYLTEK